MANGLLNDLISYWQCDEASGNLGDSHSSNTLTGKADVPSRTAGLFGNAANFNSANVVCESSAAALDFRQNPMVSFTVSMWVNFNSIKTTGSSWLWEQYDGVGNEGWGLVFRGQNSPDDWNFFMRHSAGTVSCPATPSDISAGTWHHVVIRYNASTKEMAIFIDGVKDTTDATGFQVITAGAVDFTVGGWGANGVEISNALHDEIGAWSAALSDTQVSQLYNSGSGLAYSSFDSGASGASGEDTPDHDNANDGPLFTRAMEVFSHLQANPLDSGDAAITVFYRQIPL